jgi:hypothetical protein
MRLRHLSDARLGPSAPGQWINEGRRQEWRNSGRCPEGLSRLEAREASIDINVWMNVENMGALRVRRRGLHLLLEMTCGIDTGPHHLRHAHHRAGRTLRDATPVSRACAGRCRNSAIADPSESIVAPAPSAGLTLTLTPRASEGG